MRATAEHSSRAFCGIYSVERAPLFGRRQAMNLRERIGLNIRNLRSSKKMSQEDLAHTAGIDRSYISELELARSAASVDILEKIAVAFDVDPQELLSKRG
ncbi:MAG: helix-turn-helix domain-containing protein [Maritimibacter sp.]